MDIRRYKPLSLLRDFQNAINRLFDRSLFNRDFPSIIETGETAIGFPEVDIEDNENDYRITANVPGVDPKNLEIQLDKNILSLKGKMNIEHERRGRNYIRTERSYGEFFRNFYLPDADNEAKVDAECKQGILHITIPKTKASSRRRIEIKS